MNLQKRWARNRQPEAEREQADVQGVAGDAVRPLVDHRERRLPPQQPGHVPAEQPERRAVPPEEQQHQCPAERNPPPAESTGSPRQRGYSADGQRRADRDRRSEPERDGVLGTVHHVPSSSRVMAAQHVSGGAQTSAHRLRSFLRDSCGCEAVALVNQTGSRQPEEMPCRSRLRWYDTC